jgi:hypothetical protein
MTNEMKDRIESLIKQKTINDSQIQRFKEKAEPNLTAAMEKILAKYYSKTYVKREMDLGYYEPRESLLWLAFEYAEKYCVECDDEHYLNMFTSSAYYIGDYVIQLMHGQGSVIRVDKIEHPIKPTKKEKLIDMIESRIKSEYLKHSSNLPDEWPKIAAVKIASALLTFNQEN